MRTSQTGGDGMVNFFQAERHMPGMFNGVFKMEASASTLGPGGEILSAAATKAKDMHDEEVTNLEVIYWNVSALNSALASCLITTTTGEVGTLGRRVLQAFPRAELTVPFIISY